MMNKEEIIATAELVQGDYVKYLKFVQGNALFGQEVFYQIFFEDYRSKGYELTDKIMATLNYFAQFDEEKLEWMKGLCFQHYKTCIAITDYGIEYALLEKHNNDFAEANKEQFQIYTAEEAMAKARIESVDVLEQEIEGTIEISLIINFAVPWEDEHGMKFNFYKNEFVDVE